jgi:hypothetical protein
VEDGLREENYNGIPVHQGYKLMTEIQCSVQDVDVNPINEFYAVWRVRPDACEPKNCTIQPEYHPMTGKFCELDDTGAFFLEHGKACEIMCKAGYLPTSREFICDRGIFTQNPECVEQSCEMPELPGENSAGWSFPGGRGIGGTASLRCKVGHEPFSDALRCVLPPGAPYESLPSFEPSPSESPSCRPMKCSDPPQIPNGYTSGCEGQVFGDECLVECRLGYFINGTLGTSAVTPCTGTNGTDPMRRGNNVARYVNVPECVPVTCPEPRVRNAQTLSCPNRPTDTCEVMCNRGFASLGLWSRSAQSITFTCKDIKREGVFLPDDPAESCEELACPITPRQLEPKIEHLWTPDADVYPPAMNYECSMDKPMKPGEVCVIICEDGTELPEEVIYLGCRFGQYVGYNSADMNSTKTLPAPTCRPRGDTSGEKTTVVESQMLLALAHVEDVELLTHESAKKPLGKGIKGSFLAVAEDSKISFEAEYTVHVEGAFSAIQDVRRLYDGNFDDADSPRSLANGVESTYAPTTTATPTDDPYDDGNITRVEKVRAKASVIIRFFVEADGAQAGPALDFVKDTLDDWSENPASVPMSVYDSINAALAEAGIKVRILGVSFTAPILGTKYVDKSVPEAEDPYWFVYWLAAAAAICVIPLLFFGLRSSAAIYTSRKKEPAEDSYLIKAGELTPEQERELMLEYGFRPPLQGFDVFTQTEPLVVEDAEAFGAVGPGLAPGAVPSELPSAGPAT